MKALNAKPHPPAPPLDDVKSVGATGLDGARSNEAVAIVAATDSAAAHGRRHALRSLGVAAGMPVVASVASLLSAPFIRRAEAAETWPSRPVRLIVPFATGGTTDIVSRLVAPGIADLIGQAVVVDNRAGAGGTIGAASIAQAAPDGYTIGMATVSVTGTAPAVYRKLPYDARRDFVPIIKLVDVPGVISVHPSFPAHDFASFVRELKANPGKYTYASSGQGGIGHMSMELFNLKAGTKCTHIGYRGAGPALADVLSGQVPIFWDNLSSSLPHLRSGKLIGIGLAYDRRVDELPGLPTFAELGLPDYDAASWYGLVAPAKTSVVIVERLNECAAKVLKDKSVAAKLIENGAYPAGGSSAAMAKAIDVEAKKWAEVAKFAGIEL